MTGAHDQHQPRPHHRHRLSAPAFLAAGLLSALATGLLIGFLAGPVDGLCAALLALAAAWSAR